MWLLSIWAIVYNALNKNKNPNDDQINAAMKGNICRCGTYPRVKKGIKKAIQLMQANTNSANDA